MRKILVEVTKITIGRDGLVYLTIHHYLSKNYPSLVFTSENLKKLKGDEKSTKR